MAHNNSDVLDIRIREILEESNVHGCRCYHSPDDDIDDVTAKIKQVFLEFLKIEDREIQKEVNELLVESQE